MILQKNLRKKKCLGCDFTKEPMKKMCLGCDFTLKKTCLGCDYDQWLKLVSRVDWENLWSSVCTAIYLTGF